MLHKCKYQCSIHIHLPDFLYIVHELLHDFADNDHVNGALLELAVANIHIRQDKMEQSLEEAECLILLYLSKPSSFSYTGIELKSYQCYSCSQNIIGCHLCACRENSQYDCRSSI